LTILETVEDVNYTQKFIMVDKALKHFNSTLRKRTIAVWGLAFKPNTDDMREAPSRAIIKEILREGGTVKAYDPVAIEEAKRVLALDLTDEEMKNVIFCDTAAEAATDADALMIVTEWKEFKTPNFEKLKQLLKEPVIFDGRNLFDPQVVAEYGFVYRAIGR
jgi:UDPglucose 6-dehydrogenase